jgi:hypothetical protein
MPTFPKWWSWDLSFTAHAELRMEQRDVTELEVRAMLERATGFEASVGQIYDPNPTRSKAVDRDRRARRRGQLARLVTVYEVSQ